MCRLSTLATSVARRDPTRRIPAPRRRHGTRGFVVPAVLAHLRSDFAALAARCDPEVCIRFGALRHHVLHEEFLNDVSRLVSDGGIPPERLELRIAEKVFITREQSHAEVLKRVGVRLVVDEVARGIGSLDSLARAPLWGLQLDRAWVAALRTDPVARKVCQAGIEMAAALGSFP